MIRAFLILSLLQLVAFWKILPPHGLSALARDHGVDPAREPDPVLLPGAVAVAARGPLARPRSGPGGGQGDAKF